MPPFVSFVLSVSHYINFHHPNSHSVIIFSLLKSQIPLPLSLSLVKKKEKRKEKISFRSSRQWRMSHSRNGCSRWLPVHQQTSPSSSIGERETRNWSCLLMTVSVSPLIPIISVQPPLSLLVPALTKIGCGSMAR